MWTLSFISVPADHVHNPHMVWCHMCKKTFSIKTEKTKGTVESLRHYRTERHLMRDQRWRYEHLTSVDPVSGKVQNRFRGRNEKGLTKIELAKELPNSPTWSFCTSGKDSPSLRTKLKDPQLPSSPLNLERRLNSAWWKISSKLMETSQS